MANFLAISAHPGEAAAAGELFDSAIANARVLADHAPCAQKRCDWALGAAFPRDNGSGGQVAHDSATGSWLLATGTWFRPSRDADDDADGLLERYLAGDAVALARELEGFFCMVIGDARRRELVVITDLMGSYHAFMRPTRAGLAVSGSSLLLASLEPATWDRLAVQEFIHTGVVYEERTCYREVRKLPPASVVWLSQGRIRAQTRYWSIDQVAPSSLDGEEAVAQLWHGLCATAGRIGRRFARIACDLTGGYDSRAVASGFLGARVPFVATVSGPDTSADVRVSKALARTLGVEHHHSSGDSEDGLSNALKLVALTDGEADLFEYAHVAHVHQELMDRFDISINGSYGEVARGYWWELLLPHVGKPGAFDAAKLARQRFAAGAHDSTLFAPDTRIDLAAHFAEVITRTNAAIAAAPNTLQMDHAYLSLRMQRWQGRIASSTNRLWPSLAPFLCRSLLEILLRTPPPVRLRSLLLRRMFARFQPALASHPLEHGYPPMPFSVADAWRFVPVIPYYGARVWRKLRRVLGADRSAPQSGERLLERRRRAWDVATLLEPAQMRTAGLFEPGRLVELLVEARQPTFVWQASWQRLYTLECASRVLERAQAPVRT